MQLRTVDRDSNWGILIERVRERWIVMRESDRRLIADQPSVDEALHWLEPQVAHVAREWPFEMLATYYLNGKFVYIWARTGQIMHEDDLSPAEKREEAELTNAHARLMGEGSADQVYRGHDES
jgi:hypothetical protein